MELVNDTISNNSNSKLKIKSFIKHGYAQTGGSSVEGKFEKNKHKISLENFYNGDEKLRFKNTILAIKIDVEGHELSVLKGLNNLIKRRVRIKNVWSAECGRFIHYRIIYG